MRYSQRPRTSISSPRVCIPVSPRRSSERNAKAFRCRCASGGSGPCTGTFSFDMNAFIQSGVYPALVPGEIVYCQWWSRDLQDPAGFGTGLTNALYFGIAP